MEEHFDVLIIGAGISGINAAYRLQSKFPHYRFAILEARDQLGGTWDLFKYPGIRSDSDLFTFGFAWYPWDQDTPIAEGSSILEYLHRATASHGIDQRIRYQHRLLGADWSSSEQRWSLAVEHAGRSQSMSARFIIFGTGYYDYQQPLQADIPSLAQFNGQIIHPQFWPEDLDYSDKRVVIIGSGATAITLLPKMAEKAARVTMLQRSPTYILSLPNRQSSPLRYFLPTSWFRQLQRILWLFTARFFFLFCQACPAVARAILRLHVSQQLPKTVSFAPHFLPRYNPWDQRLCVCPDGDFFKALNHGVADVRTDTIKTVTATGIQLDSGDTLDADIIVTATGLRLQVAGGASITVDGNPQHLSQKFLWRGIMMQDLPNAAFVLGYTNASWTLGADATARFLCRFLRELDNRGQAAAVPRLSPKEAQKLQKKPLMNLNSTYVVRAAETLPKTADQGPWAPRDNYLQDLCFAKFGSLEGLEFIGEAKKAQ
ncbi:flavin-containing monooxygenase [Aspergillus homomorphus CBS 101889]|uniref:Flavin-binding monooxygenase n=1 Tax=Aspergillus homomorphus (strain CBS 101889) TaxID=1450537 RepID=A0A395HPL0_ASPHC|nr:flavin-binding monooxygenase [Aspergillus homomorphus CBS 101889]RAL08798.1 flavin-binding monooxygenase [Aspergillus homomorphus CBS 101889]